MFIITRLNVLNNTVEIVSVYNLLNLAIEHIHDAVSKSENLEESQFICRETNDVLIEDSRRIEIVNRNPGWFSSGKSLTFVYQIVEYDGTYSHWTGDE